MSSLKSLAVNIAISGAMATSAGAQQGAGSMIEIKARTSSAIATIVSEGDRIICISGLDGFPESSKQVGVHPSNIGAYEITPAARTGGWKNGSAQITPNNDYAVVKNISGEIAKWSVQGNKFSIHPLSVPQILEEYKKCSSNSTSR